MEEVQNRDRKERAQIYRDRKIEKKRKREINKEWLRYTKIE